MKSLEEITGKELGTIEEGYVVDEFETTIMTDDDFFDFFRQNLDQLNKWQYELLEDGLINVEKVASIYEND